MPRKGARDEQGWRVPGADTKSWQLYHLLRDGWQRKEIARLFGEKPESIYALCDGIIRAEIIAERTAKREDRVVGEEYIQKLMGILGWSREQAMAEVERQEKKGRI